ncbi:hypothetical protein CRYUN_Cryun29cG0030400 [Craigia yunnanensis]
MIRDIVPVNVNLKKRCILDDPICPRCNQANEIVAHAIRYCPEAVKVWKQLSFAWDNLAVDDVEVDGWLSQIVGCLSQEVLQEMAVTYKEAQMKPSLTLAGVSGMWTPPTGYTLKANFDGALKSAENRGRIGVVIRNNKREVMVAKLAWY